MSELWRILAQQQAGQRREAAAAEAAYRAAGELREQLFELWRRSTDHERVIAAVGYAGFFAVWGFTRELISAKLSAAAGLLMMFSTMVFVTWEVVQLLVLGWSVTSLARTLARNPSSIMGAAQALAEKQRTQAVRFASAYVVAVALMILPAVVAVGIMAGCLALALVADL